MLRFRQSSSIAVARGALLGSLLLLGALTQAAEVSPSPPAYAVHLVKTTIPMPDGVQLAATLFMPAGKAAEKFPVLLEYLPYRKDDGTIARDYPMHTYFAHRGYVTARVDIRGTGASEGETPHREYSQQEQLDAEQVIAWLARQSWSNGNVGMFGISWGGFNSIQLAMRQPPALKAIVAVAATEALFPEDVHYFDGMMHVDEFEVVMDLDQSMSRSPDFPLDERTLRQRFDNPPWSLTYMREQRDGAFWHEPVRELKNIRIPVFLVGGMLDGYRDSIPRMLERMDVPMKALIGPWNHDYPDEAVPGPQVEWRREVLRWWDYWLKDRDTGILREPPIAVYMRHWYPPGMTLQSIPGEWRSEARWPPPEARDRTLFLGASGTLKEQTPRSSVDALRYVPSSGVEAGFWWGDLTADQRPADAFSLTYDSEPLKEDTAILGRPRTLLRASATAPLADWFVRLSDVAPDGTVTLVTGAGLNGAQRDSAQQPQPLMPGQVYPLAIRLHLTSWVFPKGHRIRLAVSNAWWPTIWSTPYAMTTSLQLGGAEASRLILPLVPAHVAATPRFAPLERSDELAGVTQHGNPWPGEYHVIRDAVRQSTVVQWSGSDATEYPWGKRTHHEALTYEVQDAHPEINVVQGDSDTTFALKGRSLFYRGHLEMRSDAKTFHYRYRRELFENGKLVRRKQWTEAIPRDFQ